MTINPLLTLIVLYVGHSRLGLRGILRGLPAAAHAYRVALMVTAATAPGRGAGKGGTCGRDGKEG